MIELKTNAYTLDCCEFSFRDSENPYCRPIGIVTCHVGQACGATEFMKKDELGVTGLGIDRDYKRQGLGTKLLDEVFKLAKEKGLKAVVLATFTKNTTAMRFYGKLGFKERVKVSNRNENEYVVLERKVA